MTYVGSRPANKPVNQTDIEDDAISLAKLAGGTDGNVISYDASGNPVAIATGSDGQVLTSTGAGSPPAFEAIPASGVSLSGSTNNTVATVSGANAIVGEAGLIFDGSKLGIGTSTMTRTLNVTDTASGASTGIQLIGANNGTQFINFGDTDDTNVGEINYDHSTNKMNFRTNDAYAMVIDNAGIITKPLQPAFSVNKSTNAQAVNAAYVDTSFNNEIFDNNGDMTATTFTAPVTGKYQFNWNVIIVDITASATGTLIGKIGTSNRTYHGGKIQDYNDIFDADPARWSINFSVLADMDANDTATFALFSNDAVQIYNDGEATHASGYLAC